jgi:hypothetical protein
MHVFLVLLIFGNLTDIFTDRTFDLCTINFTMFDSVCPFQLTIDNFLNEYTYVFNLFRFKFYFILFI